jgi:hypothetical protein
LKHEIDWLAPEKIRESGLPLSKLERLQEVETHHFSKEVVSNHIISALIIVVSNTYSRTLGSFLVRMLDYYASAPGIPVPRNAMGCKECLVTLGVLLEIQIGKSYNLAESLELEAHSAIGLAIRTQIL